MSDVDEVVGKPLFAAAGKLDVGPRGPAALSQDALPVWTERTAHDGQSSTCVTVGRRGSGRGAA
jgi:hypothetical protein